MSRLRTKFVAAAFLVQFAVFGTLLLANQLLLEPWFVWWAQDEMEETFRIVQNLPPETFSTGLRRQAAETGFRLTVSDGQGRMIDSSVPEYRRGPDQLLPKDQRESFLAHRATLEEGRRLFEVIDKEPRGQSVVSAFYRLGDDQYFNATMPLNQLRRNVSIASGLFLVLGLSVLTITMAGIYLLSRKVVQPIRDLDSLAQSIASRQFAARYRGTGTDELDHLGRSMNQMADQLRAALEETEEKNQELKSQLEAQQRFFASVSHEFKTPLGLIRGYGELLQAEAKVPKASRDQAVSVILDEVDQLVRRVDDLLTLTKLGRPEYSLKLRPADLSAVVARAGDRFREHLKTNGLSLTTRLDSGGPVALDESRFQQALDNVLANALRHADPGTTIDVAAVQNGEFCEVRITNQGPAIDEANLPKIFQPFYRVDSHRNRNDGGSGLGLSIVAEILRLHGGSVEARNTGQGVTVILKLPHRLKGV